MIYFSINDLIWHVMWHPLLSRLAISGSCQQQSSIWLQLMFPIDQGLYSLSGKMANHQISWRLAKLRVWMLWEYHSGIWQASRQKCCWGAFQISERLEKFKPESYGLETSWDHAVRHLTTYWIKAQCLSGSPDILWYLCYASWCHGT